LIATFRKRIERIGHSWQRVIVFREVRAAIRDEIRKQFFELWRRTEAPFGFKQSLAFAPPPIRFRAAS
jgi:hypothetical protein